MNRSPTRINNQLVLVTRQNNDLVSKRTSGCLRPSPRAVFPRWPDRPAPDPAGLALGSLFGAKEGCGLMVDWNFGGKILCRNLSFRPFGLHSYSVALSSLLRLRLRALSRLTASKGIGAQATVLYVVTSGLSYPPKDLPHSCENDSNSERSGLRRSCVAYALPTAAVSRLTSHCGLVRVSFEGERKKIRRRKMAGVAPVLDIVSLSCLWPLPPRATHRNEARRLSDGNKLPEPGKDAAREKEDADRSGREKQRRGGAVKRLCM